MIRNPPLLQAQFITALPEIFHRRTPASRWAEMTRPGVPMHSFLEAAFFDGENNLWLSDVACGRVFCVSPDLEWTVVHELDGAPHAMRIAPDGSRVAVDYYSGLIQLDAFDVVTRLNAEPADQPFLGLSDMAYAPDGALWFTDSGRTSLTNPRGRVYRWKQSELRLVIDCVPYANGIALSPDGAVVYIAATRANEVWRFAANLPDEGQPMVGTFLHLSGGLGPDGLATNSKGWLAVAQAQAGRAYVFTAMGDAIAEVRLPQGLWTTSVTFHPDDPNRLIVIEAQFGAVYFAQLPEGI